MAANKAGTSQTTLQYGIYLTRKMEKSPNRAEKKLYQKAVFVLGKIIINESAGSTIEEGDIKYQKQNAKNYVDLLK